MVKVNEDIPFLIDGQIDIEQWLQTISTKGYFQDQDLLRAACQLAQIAGQDHAIETGESCLQHGIAIANVLADLEVDPETLAAAILYVCVQYAELSEEDVADQINPQIADLIRGVEKMNSISQTGAGFLYPISKQQNEHMRKMLLAMVDDVRVVLIKLADRLCVLRSSAPIPAPMRIKLANEVMSVYAPLANRLGIGALKWEMEDLAFRYLQPEAYKAIAKDLKSKRLHRDRYVQNVVDILNKKLQDLGFKHFAVYGRSKHIHSIYRKMTRKGVSLDQIYDVTAVRILVDTEEQCYEVLGWVHQLWHQVQKEYDDYIMKPKGNGYQSLHTAVEGPENRIFEVQIRTFRMHELAEMGVAAHWKYKEGGKFKPSHERKIEWLRQVLAWHKDLSLQSEHPIDHAFMEDRVYVFTPDGDILDMPVGATTLDFAYHVHTEMGHRCRGTKVNGSIVPLTYTLKTGDKIEILTGKESKPSRDWVNPHLNYLKTARAKAKVMHWFKMQDYEKNCTEGRELIDKELKALGIKISQLQDLLPLSQAKTLEDLFAALGRGDVKLNYLLSRLTPNDKPLILPKATPSKIRKSSLEIEGVGNLLTHMARCCQPLPGQPVLGYITLGRGVSIHRQDCLNILNATAKQQERFLAVNWNEGFQDLYKIDVCLQAYDRHGLLKDVTTLLTQEKCHVLSLKTAQEAGDSHVSIYMILEIDSMTSLSRLISRLEHIPNVIEARRLV